MLLNTLFLYNIQEVTPKQQGKRPKLVERCVDTDKNSKATNNHSDTAPKLIHRNASAVTGHE